MITIYGTEWCVYCPMVKRLFDAKGIKYQYIDLTNNRELHRRLIEKTGLHTVPITTNGEEYLAGYNVQRLLELAHE